MSTVAPSLAHGHGGNDRLLEIGKSPNTFTWYVKVERYAMLNGSPAAGTLNNTLCHTTVSEQPPLVHAVALTRLFKGST